MYVASALLLLSSSSSSSSSPYPPNSHNIEFSFRLQRRRKKCTKIITNKFGCRCAKPKTAQESETDKEIATVCRFFAHCIPLLSAFYLFWFFFFAFACVHEGEGKKLKIKKIHTWHRYTKLIIINTQREHCVLCMNSMHNAKSTALQPSSQKVMYFMRTEKQNKQCFQILFFFWCAFVCRLWHWRCIEGLVILLNICVSCWLPMVQMCTQNFRCINALFGAECAALIKNQKV